MKKNFIKTPLIGVQVHGAKDVGTRTVNLLMGEHAGEYVRGDIMDANAVIQAFDELRGNVDNDHDSLYEIVDELHNLRDATDQGFEVFQEKAEEETDNRIQGDKALGERIDTEKQERINADTELRNDLTAETNRAQASENALSSDIQAEAAKRESDDNAIKDSLNAEVTRATDKENEIKAEVDIINGDSTTEGSFRKAIADVVGAAPEAYDTLKEIADKLKSNDDLHTAINDAIAEKATTAALDEEITRAKAAESGIKNELADKADATALATLEQKVTANTAAIDTKQPKGNYLTEQSLEGYAKKTDIPQVDTSDFVSKTATDPQSLKSELSVLNTLNIVDGINDLPMATVREDNGNMQLLMMMPDNEDKSVSLSTSKLQIGPHLGQAMIISRYGIQSPDNNLHHAFSTSGGTIDLEEYVRKEYIGAGLNFADNTLSVDNTALTALEKKVADNTAAIPTKVSQLQNDSEFITKSVYDEKIAALEARIAALEAKHSEAVS